MTPEQKWLERLVNPLLKRESDNELIELLDCPELPLLQRKAIHEELAQRHRKLSTWLTKMKLSNAGDRRRYRVTFEAPPDHVPAHERLQRLKEVADTICRLQCVEIEEIPE
jgi:hypothetical protein